MEFVHGEEGEDGIKVRRERCRMTWVVEKHVGFVTRGARVIRSYTGVIGLIGDDRDARVW